MELWAVLLAEQTGVRSMAIDSAVWLCIPEPLSQNLLSSQIFCLSVCLHRVVGSVDARIIFIYLLLFIFVELQTSSYLLISKLFEPSAQFDFVVANLLEI